MYAPSWSRTTRGGFLFRQQTSYEMRMSAWSSDVCSSDLFERLGLRRGARVAVEDHRHVATEFVEPFADQARYDRVGHQLARVHDRLCLKADGGAGLDRGVQHVAARQLDHAMRVLERPRLRSLARARRAQQTAVPLPGSRCT